MIQQKDNFTEIKRVGEVNRQHLISTWIKDEKWKVKKEILPNGYLDACATMLQILSSKSLNFDIIPLEIKGIMAALASGSVAFIEGIPGTGKTESVRIIAELFNRLGLDTKLITINMAQLEPADVVGEQIVDLDNKNVSKNIVNQTFFDIKEHKETCFIIFMDEVNRAEENMVAISLKVIDGILNPTFSIPKNSATVCAGNKGAMDQTNAIPFLKMDKAFSDRAILIHHLPDARTWIELNKFSGSIHPKLIESIEREINTSAFQKFIFCDDICQILSPRHLTILLQYVTVLKTIVSGEDLMKTVDTELNRLDISEYRSEDNGKFTTFSHIPDDIKLKLSQYDGAKDVLRRIFHSWSKNEEDNLTNVNPYMLDFDPISFIEEASKNSFMMHQFNSYLYGEKNNDQEVFSLIDNRFKDYSKTITGVSEVGNKCNFIISQYARIIKQSLTVIKNKKDFVSVYKVFVTNALKELLGKEYFKKIIFQNNIKVAGDLTNEHLVSCLRTYDYLNNSSPRNLKLLFATALICSDDTEILNEAVETLKNFFNSNEI